MVGNASLREVVSSYALGAVARSDLTSSVGRYLFVLFRLHFFVNARTQYFECFFLVLVLASLVLTVNHGACRNVNYSYRRFGLVDVLTARAARTVGLDDEVVLVYFNVYIFNLGQNRNRRR